MLVLQFHLHSGQVNFQCAVAPTSAHIYTLLLCSAHPAQGSYFWCTINCRKRIYYRQLLGLNALFQGADGWSIALIREATSLLCRMFKLKNSTMRHIFSQPWFSRCPLCDTSLWVHISTLLHAAYGTVGGCPKFCHWAAAAEARPEETRCCNAPAQAAIQTLQHPCLSRHKCNIFADKYSHANEG